MEQRKNILILGSAIQTNYNSSASFNRAMEMLRALTLLNNNCYLLLTKIELNTEKELILQHNDDKFCYNKNIYYFLKEYNIDIVISLSYTPKILRYLNSICNELNIIFIYDYVEHHISKALNNFFSFRLGIIFKNFLILLDSLTLLRFFKLNKIKLFVISHNLKNYLIENSINTIHFLPILLSKNTYKKSEIVIPKTFGICGSLTQSKDDILTLLVAFYRIKKLKCKLYLYGQPKKSSLILIKILIKILGLDKLIFIKGNLPYDELIKELSEKDCLLVTKTKTKQNYYNFPTKIVDYLYAERPVILPNFGETENWFQNKYNCLKYEVGSSKSLAKTIDLFLKLNNSEKQQLIENFKKLSNDFDSVKNLRNIKWLK